MPFTYTQTINAPAAEVFSCLDDASKMRRWMKGWVGVRYLSQSDVPAPMQGVKFKHKLLERGQLQEMEGEILRYQSPSYMSLRLGNERFQADVSYYLVPVDDGCTRLHYEAQVSVPHKTIVERLFQWFSTWQIERSLKRQLHSLKRVAER